MKIDFKIMIAVIILLLFILITIGNKSMFSKWFTKRENFGPVLKEPDPASGIKILFLHHSTGRNIWDKGVLGWFTSYNAENNVNYAIVEQNFPKKSPYGWNNYPFDYWNIWVNHAGEKPYREEPTLEMISKFYDLVIWKHCYPVGKILDDTGKPNVTSEIKSLENYKIQYNALREKMMQFPETKFLIWTIPALTAQKTSKDMASRTKAFYHWVKNTWDQKGDNIYLWDFYELETEGGLYLKAEYAKGPENSHPNECFSEQIAPFFCQRIVDVIEGRGDESQITGKKQ